MSSRDLPVPPQADPWAGELTDFAALHQQATEAVLLCVDKLRRLGLAGDRDSPRPVPLVVLGTAGVGKTHLFGRLRRKLGPRAVLVHLRPLVGSDITPRYLLSQILEQLGFESCGLRQIDALAGSILGLAQRGTLDYPPTVVHYPQTVLDDVSRMPPERRAELMDKTLEQLLGKNPILDEAYLRRLLGVPFLKPLARTATLAWLGGRELDDLQASRIGVRQALSEPDVTRALRTLTAVAAPAAPLLLVFDQLENLIDAEGHRVRAYGNLIAELVDVVRDVVIVQMALDAEWSAALEPHFAQSQRQRVCGRRLVLGCPTAKEAEGLLRLWISRIPDPDDPFPWPLTPAQLQGLTNTPWMTPRQLLLDLRRALEGELPEVISDAVVPEPLGAILSRTWEKYLVEARAYVDRMAELALGPEPARIVEGLTFLARLVRELDELESSKDSLRLQTPSGPLLVTVLHDPNPRSLAVACRRLKDFKGRVLGLREQWRDIKPTWTATQAERTLLLSRPGARWHWLSRNDAVSLLALASLLKDAISRDVSGPDAAPVDPQRVIEWVQKEQVPSDWDITRTLLGPDTGEPLVPSPVTAAASGPGNVAVQGAGALSLLVELRVASLERLQRDLARASPGITRATVLRELRTAGARVKWYGENLVSVAT